MNESNLTNIVDGNLVVMTGRKGKETILPNKFDFVSDINSICKLVYHATKNDKGYIIEWSWDEDKKQGIEAFKTQCQYTEKQMKKYVNNKKFIIT